MSKIESTDKLDIFSDGIYAISITVLFSELKIPSAVEFGTFSKLAQVLLEMWSSYFAICLSAFTLVTMWINHRSILAAVEKLRLSAILSSTFLIMMISFVNFSTSLLAEHIRSDSMPIAARVYCLNYFLICIGYNVFWQSVIRGNSVIKDSFSSDLKKKVSLILIFGLIVYFGALVLSFFAPTIALTMVFLLWSLWIYMIRLWPEIK